MEEKISSVKAVRLATILALALYFLGVANIVDREGRLIAFKDSSKVLKNLKVDHIKPVQDFLQNVKAGSDKKSVTYKGIMGKTVVGRYSSLISPDWAVVIEMPWEEAYKEGLMILVFSLILFVILTGLSGIAGNIIAGRIAGPLIKLTKIANRIALGETGLEASEIGPREIASLAGVFNIMTKQLVNKADGFRKTSEFLAEIITKATDITLNLNSFTQRIDTSIKQQESGSGQASDAMRQIAEIARQSADIAAQTLKADSQKNQTGINPENKYQGI